MKILFSDFLNRPILKYFKDFSSASNIANARNEIQIFAFYFDGIFGLDLNSN